MPNQINAIQIVREYQNGNKSVVIEEACSRCGGDGNFAHLQHTSNGTCFKCNGTGVTPKTIKVASDVEVELVTATTQKKPTIIVNTQMELHEDFIAERKATQDKVNEERAKKLAKMNESLANMNKTVVEDNEDDFMSLFE